MTVNFELDLADRECGLYVDLYAHVLQYGRVSRMAT